MQRVHEADISLHKGGWHNNADIRQRARFGEGVPGFFFCLALFLALISFQARAQVQPLVKIVVFGDSLTSGYQLQPDQAFPALVEKRLNAAGFNVKVFNMSLAGETTTGGFQRLRIVFNAQPDLVILQLGANDALRGLDINKVTNTNLHSMLTALNKNNISIMLVGMKAPPNMGREYAAQMQNMYEQLAFYHRVAYFDPFFLEGIVGDSKLNLADGYHPNAEGVKKIVDRLYPNIDRLVRWLTEVKKHKAMYGDN